jgi:hypothetical protein
VLSIGVAIFNETEIVATDGWAIDLAADVGGHVDWGTVKWWMEQDAMVRAFSWGGQMSAYTVAFNFKTFIAQHNPTEFWSKDPHFDHVILENWWRRVNESVRTWDGRGTAPFLIGDFPIGYRQPRAYRTLVGEAKDLGYDAEEERGIYAAHNPIDDAAQQARAVIAARAFIRGIPR